MQYNIFSHRNLLIVFLGALLIGFTFPEQAFSQRRKPKKTKVVKVNKQRRRNRVVVKTNSRKPHVKYAHLPKRGTTVKIVPTGHKVITHRNIHYRFHKGVFYKPMQGAYVIVKAPRGVRIKTLPVGYRRVVLKNRNYYYYYGTYYTVTSNSNEYEVVDAPIGALVESIPEGYEEIEVNGDTYYVADGVYYLPVSKDGEIWYEVVEAS